MYDTMTDMMHRARGDFSRQTVARTRELLRAMAMDIRMDERASTLEDLQRRYTLTKRPYIVSKDLR